MTQSTIKAPRKTSITPVKPVPSAPAVARMPTHDEITQRARALWEAKGRPIGQDNEIWFDAEAQLKKEQR